MRTARGDKAVTGSCHSTATSTSEVRSASKIRRSLADVFRQKNLSRPLEVYPFLSACDEIFLYHALAASTSEYVNWWPPFSQCNVTFAPASCSKEVSSSDSSGGQIGSFVPAAINTFVFDTSGKSSPLLGTIG